MALTKKVIGFNSVDGARLLLDNEQALRAKNASGVAQDVLKLDVDGKLQLLKMPEVSDDASSANQLVRFSQFDAFVQKKGAANGLAELDVNGKLVSSQVPAIAITDVFVVATIAARDALSGIEEGDVAKVTDAGSGLPKTYIHDGTNWLEIESGSDVDTVNGQTGTVVLDAGDLATTGIGYGASTIQSDLDAMLLKDGSRVMTGPLNMGGNYNVFNATSFATVSTPAGPGQTYGRSSGVTAGLISTYAEAPDSSGFEIAGGGDGYLWSESSLLLQGTIVKVGDTNSAIEGILDLQDGQVKGLAALTGSEDADVAAPKGYIDARETAITTAYQGYADQAEADAKSYTDAQLDTLTVQQLGYEAKTLSAGEVSARQITLTASVVGTPWIMLDNVLLKPVVDFTVSGAVVSWPEDVPSLVGEELVEGDVLHVWYHKNATPFA